MGASSECVMGPREIVVACGAGRPGEVMLGATGGKGTMNGSVMSAGGAVDRRCSRYRQLGKVGARQPRLVRVMDHDRSVAEVGWAAGLERRVEVKVLGHEGIRRDLAVLSAEVADLARLGLGSIAGRSLAAMVRVQMGQC